MKNNWKTITIAIIILIPLGISCISSAPPPQETYMIKLNKETGPPPPEPGEVHGGTDGMDYGFVAWSKVEGADSYKIYMKAEDSSWQQVTTFYPRENGEDPWCRIRLVDLRPGTVYSFRITSVNANGESEGILTRFHTNNEIRVTDPDMTDIFTPDNSFREARDFTGRGPDSTICTISPAGDTDYFRFEARAGRLYWFTARKLAWQDSYPEHMVIISLFDENLNPVDVPAGDNEWSGIFTGISRRGWDGLYEIAGWPCPADGLYYIRVRVHEADTDGLARYVFSLRHEEREQ